MSLGTVIFSIIALKFGIKNIIINKTVKESFPISRHVLPAILSLITILVFSYVFIQSFVGNPDVLPTTFGAIFIRPISFWFSVYMAMDKKLKYYNSIRIISEIVKIEECIHGRCNN